MRAVARFNDGLVSGFRPGKWWPRRGPWLSGDPEADQGTWPTPEAVQAKGDEGTTKEYEEALGYGPRWIWYKKTVSALVRTFHLQKQMPATKARTTVKRSKPVASVVDRRTVEIPDEQKEARIRMGTAIRIWFRLNNWSQDVPNAFAKDRDLNGPWNSQVSLWYHGKLDPKPQYWLSVEEFNKAVAEQDFTDLQPWVIKRITGSQPFFTEHERVADAVDFFSMFIGRTKWSDRYDKLPVVTEDEAESKGRSFMKALEDLMLERCLTRAEAWELVSRNARFAESLLTDADPIALKKWFVGLTAYDPEMHMLFGKALDGALKDIKS